MTQNIINLILAIVALLTLIWSIVLFIQDDYKAAYILLFISLGAQTWRLD